MININDQLWIIKNVSRNVEDSDHPLAYMTYVETKSDGTDAQSFLKRKSTGTSWAKGRGNTDFNVEEHSLIINNVPQTDFKIVGSVSRWSTDNKVIRVEDPRGFVVEIPTGNLTTLLKHCVVDKGVVKEGCVWGREGGNHILLPVNSDVYSEATNKIEKNDSRVSFSKLSVGDVVRFHVEDRTEYAYAGKAKVVWKVYERTSVEKNYTRYYNRPWKRLENDPKTEVLEITDDKWNHVFVNLREGRWCSNEYKQTGKAIIERKSEVPDVESFQVSLPQRLKPEFMEENYYREQTYYTCETVDFKWKGSQ